MGVPERHGLDSEVSSRIPPVCLDEHGIYSLEALAALCYPLGPRAGRECTDRLWRLEEEGVESICSQGSTTLPGARLRVLGKGHAGVVLAAFSRKHGLVAVKARRLDSKRPSLSQEAARLVEASLAGASPRVFYHNDDLIVMEMIAGPRLEEMVEAYGLTLDIVIEALEAARALDTTRLLHLELSRPWRSIIYTCDSRYCRALIIDLESARRGCGNVPLVLSGLSSRSRRLRAVVETLRGDLREYTLNDCPRRGYEKVKKTVAEAFLEEEGERALGFSLDELESTPR